MLEYDGDYLNAMYATPHSWTPFGRSTLSNVIEPDQRKWDYRHQVLAHPRLGPWQLFLAVKWMELCFHLRPRRMWSILCERRPMRRRQLLWCTLHIGLVWVGEIVEFVIDACRARRRRRIKSAPSPAPDDSPPTALVELRVARRSTVSLETALRFD